MSLVFSKFLELGSARQTLLWFLEHGLQVPVSTPHDKVVWRRPRYSTIHNLLSNPAYAGAYAYGKTEPSSTTGNNRDARVGANRKISGGR
jgi:hypothetical protein